MTVEIKTGTTVTTITLENVLRWCKPDSETLIVEHYNGDRARYTSNGDFGVPVAGFTGVTTTGGINDN